MMNTKLDRSMQTIHRQRTTFETKVSPYDVFQAMLTSLVVLAGFFAVLLFLIWLTTVFGIRKAGPKFEFYVVRYEFLP